MNSFGLGLVLNFTDNATAGMSNAARAFNNLSLTADSASSSLNGTAMDTYAVAQSMVQVGDVAQSAGNAILGVFLGISKQVVDTGMTIQGFRMQMGALYGEDAGEKKIQEIKNYAATSVFEVKGLMSAVTMMKAVGIEAMDEVSTSTGKTTQKLMDYASDLAAMMPNMRNVYGTGVNASMGAFKEYIAEGNKISLKRGAGLDITQMLGEDKGATIEERTRQVADLIEQLGIAGYTAKLYGTPAQQMSNINDVIFNTLSDISDSGVFDSFCKLLSTASGFIQGLTVDEHRYAVITQMLSDVISSLIAPLQKVLDFVVANADAFLDWIEANPLLAKTLLLSVAALGALLVMSGTVLKFSGNILMLVLAVKNLGGMAKVLSILRVGFTSLLKSILPIVIIASALYLAWKNNLFGIRDLVKSVFGQVVDIVSLTFDALSDSTLSDENFELARKLGILPFIESLLDLRYHFGFFITEFKKGFEAVFTTINTVIGKIASADGVLYNLVNRVGEFIKKFMNPQEGSTDAWGKVGDAIGKIVGVLAVALPLILTAIKVFKIVSGVAKVVGVLISGISAPIAILIGAVALLAVAWSKNFGGIQEKTKAVLGSIMGWLGNVDWSSMWVNFKTAVQDAFSAIVEFYHTYIEPVVGLIIEVVMNIVNIIVNVWTQWVQPLLEQVGAVIGALWTNVLAPLLGKVAVFVAKVVELIMGIVAILMMVWNNVLAPIVNWLVTVLAPIIQSVVSVVLGVIRVVATVVGEVVGAIISILTGIIDFIVGVFSGNWEKAWTGIVEVFGGIFDGIIAIVKGVINTVILVINTMASAIYGVIATIVNGIGGVIEGIASALGFGDLNMKISAVPPQIPYLATGGVATDDTVAHLGEGKFDEAVLPLSPDIFNKIAQGISKASSMSNSTPQSGKVEYDYSVTFAEGSIVLQVANSTEAEMRKAAEYIMQYIKRKQELQAMTVRR